ncbi:universal stress protein [Desulfatitalea alkaliphila]|uniref:Universal stress protein n=1 Tax=Desulfatitalea alkaliphila TaxID=2929485 RepID=A0AA41R290_9BACT|nr:universal stress protein [Desulfatitalea alkaliphila]MCJ8499535.1 universal stress protein [Desulfatitalea alkaliphila]
MYKKVMVPLDGSALAECVFPHVEAFVEGFKLSDVIFVRVVDPDKTLSSAEDYADLARLAEFEKLQTSPAKKYIQKIRERFNHMSASVHSEVLEGRIADSLIEFADKKGVDVIIIATHGRSGASRWLMGSIADKLIRSAKIPVFIVRAPVAGWKGL